VTPSPLVTQSTEDLGPSITCFPSGRKFYLDSPVWDVSDMAWALGMMCRYGGHVRHFYSVAEHSVMVSILMEELKLGDPFEGLMHDGHESIIIDMLSPWKTRMPEYKKIEHTLETDLRNNFKLPAETTFGCHTADSLALYIESWFLKADRGADMKAKVDCKRQAMELVEKRGWRIVSLSPAEATAAFLKRYTELTGVVPHG
jgi:5'-deoxynucleotidase YfbR-like HD superfamily hydrolase